MTHCAARDSCRRGATQRAKVSGLIWTCLAPEPGAVPDLPVMPHWDDPDYQQIVCRTVDIGGFAGRQLKGFLDVAHFGFVPAATFGDPENVEVPLYVPKQNPKGFEVDEEVHAFNLRVFEEDRLIVESQKPDRLPLDLALESHITADRSSIAYRRGLKRTGLGRFFLV